MLLMMSYWITVFSSSEFVIFIGDDHMIIYDFLPTVPFIWMLIEFPFNMIPLDWPMLIFVELLFTVYLLVNFLIVSLDPEHKTVYEAFDWYHYPLRSFGAVLGCYAALAAFFAMFWAISNKIKLPRYAARKNMNLEKGLHSRVGSMCSMAETLDEDETDG